MYDKSACLIIVLIAFYLGTESTFSEENMENIHKHGDPPSFIAARMKHLTAVNELKQVKNAVKQHQLVLDLFKKVFKILDESRKLVASIESRADMTKKASQYVVNYLENIAFFCDLLVFFPEITVRHLDANLLWRVTLIDSIQDATSFNINFVDDTTQAQFEKAYSILSEGASYQNEPNQPPEVKKNTESKKTKRRPRMSSNEL
ncbi:uncharacterized protein LOC117654161 isoform X2 [Thrips palmi]|uniref:Uncharacterized protein LOC117654161 isoform X2 n=1 Tax=Thrips palmi TaxID=161013 RepID=A0A6P9AFZ5_THRPL|nr:uncharacterized protein LOC117654161 isoform X2 [Thrips palmi]